MSSREGKNVLVTGGAGLIGRRLVALLLERGNEVTVLDDFRLSDDSYRCSGARYVVGNVTDPGEVEAIIGDVDAVAHLAAPSSFLMYEEDVIDATVRTISSFVVLLEAMRRAEVSKIVYASTSAVYEGNGFPYVESMSLRPRDLKAISKKWGEEAAQHYSDRYGITAIGLRPFSVYGAGEETKGGYANVVSLFAWAMMNGNRPIVWGDGSQTRDYLYVDDMAMAFVLALETEDIPTQCFNVGSGVETTFLEIIDLINQELGTSHEPLFVPVPIEIYAERLLADTTRQESVLGLVPTVNLREGIRRTIEYARSTPDARRLVDHQLYGTTPQG